MPPASADLATTWAFLEKGFNHIMTKPTEAGISKTKLMGLYTVAEYYCTSSRRMHDAADSALGSENCSKKAFLSATAGSMSDPGG